MIDKIHAAATARWPLLSRIASLARLQREATTDAEREAAAAALLTLTAAALPLQREARRVYLLDTPLHTRALLRDLGATWDADRRAWWVGTSRAPQLAELRDQILARHLDGREVDPSWAVVVGSCTHHGRPARVLWAAGGEVEPARAFPPPRRPRPSQDRPAALLCDLPGERSWRAPEGQIEGLRRYRRARSIRALEDYARALATTSLPPARYGGPEVDCWECGAHYEGPGWVEPGAMGCVRCG